MQGLLGRQGKYVFKCSEKGGVFARSWQRVPEGLLALPDCIPS